LHGVDGVVGPGHIEDDLLVRRVEAEIRGGERFSARVDRGLPAAEIEQQPLERECRQKELRIGNEESLRRQRGRERRGNALESCDGFRGEHGSV